jgi:phage terminase large subunit-like protein
MIEHRGHPITRWSFRNVVLAGDRHGGFSIDKERSKEKVDGPQALADAMARAMLAGGSGAGVYEERGPIIIEDVYL